MIIGSYLLLNLEGPLMSFGGPKIDGRASGYPVPTKSMVTGMIGNACGIDRSQVDWLQQLQDGLGMACAILRPGVELIDYQTADISQPHMGGPGHTAWSASGVPFKREGSSDALGGRRQQWRPYIADGHFIVALWAAGPLPLTLADAAAALDEPMRYVYLGRASCAPTSRISMGLWTAASPREALELAVGDRHMAGFVLPYDPASPPDGRHGIRQVSGERNWRLDRHTGTQVLAHHYQPAAGQHRSTWA